MVSRPPDAALVRLLEGHPAVSLVRPSSGAGLAIDQSGWKRRLLVGDASVEVHGLVELMDNNPMVCADAVSVPGAASTLALIALGPLVDAGLLLEEPALQFAGVGREDVSAFLGQSAVASFGDEDLKGCAAVNALAVVETPSDWGEIEGLYRERFAHSFYIREHVGGEWDVALVKGRPFATYTLSWSPGDEASLLTVRAMADLDGKCGAAQVVHAMNVMCGFEECLGLGV